MSIAEQSPTLGPDSAGTLMTMAEFDAADLWEPSHVYELINGVLVVNPPPHAAERGPNELLGNLLYVYQTKHDEGAALDDTLAEHTIRTRQNRRRADRAIWANMSRPPNVEADQPTIAVEFVSAGLRNRMRDYEAKRAEYAEIGIAEYWIIDRFQRQMTVVRMQGEVTEEIFVGESDVYTTALLPGFELPLAVLLAKADRYEQS